jgi:hypothetical protein
MVRHCHCILVEDRETPTTKVAALEIVRDLLETCQVPCVNLLEVYLLPFVYRTATAQPQETRERRGTAYFQQFAKGTKIANLEDTAHKFVRLCEEMLFVGALLKPKSVYEGSELNKKSDFAEYF